MDGPERMAVPDRDPASDEYTVRISRRTVRLVVVTALIVLALVAGIAIGVSVAGSGGSGAGDGGDRAATSGTDQTTGATTTAPATTTSAAVPTTAPPAVTQAPPAAADGAVAANDAGQGGAAAPGAPVAQAAPTATANVTLSLGRACVGAALTTSVIVEWHGTLGQSYFLQVNQSNGQPLIHQGVGSDGTQTFPNVACGLLPVHAQFVTNTATGSVSASAVT